MLSADSRTEIVLYTLIHILVCGGDGELPLYPMTIDELLNQPIALRLFDKILEEGRSQRSIWFGTNRLLHRRKLAVENPGTL